MVCHFADSNALECNNTLLDLARVVVEEVEKAGGIGACLGGPRHCLAWTPPEAGLNSPQLSCVQCIVCTLLTRQNRLTSVCERMVWCGVVRCGVVWCGVVWCGVAAAAFYCMAPVISDGNTQGTRGMRYSLISRDWIADCVEIMHEGYMADACISFGACDKTVPGAVMPLARTDTSSCFIYGGPLGRFHIGPTASVRAISEHCCGVARRHNLTDSFVFATATLQFPVSATHRCEQMRRLNTTEAWMLEASLKLADHSPPA